MTTVKNLYDAINEWAPFQTAMSFDNVGLLVGDGNASVTKGLVALDVTPFVLEEAVSDGSGGNYQPSSGYFPTTPNIVFQQLALSFGKGRNRCN